jgi:hypothetical protein
MRVHGRAVPRPPGILQPMYEKNRRLAHLYVGATLLGAGAILLLEIFTGAGVLVFWQNSHLEDSTVVSVQDDLNLPTTTVRLDNGHVVRVDGVPDPPPHPGDRLAIRLDTTEEWAELATWGPSWSWVAAACIGPAFLLVALGLLRTLLRLRARDRARPGDGGLGGRP